MSLRYKGAVISATPPTTSTSSASGAWTLEQQMQAQGAGTWPFGGPFNYIEDVFSTYLYTGNGTSQSIVNGVDLSTYGGLVWIKSRSAAATMNVLFDSVRGATKNLYSNTTGAPVTEAGQAFTSTGFTVTNFGETNGSGQTQASWTFRKQPKFFDVVTYTGNGSVQNIAHALGSVPGCIIVKATSFAGTRWNVYHRAASATPQNGRLALNTPDAYAEYPAVPSFADLWNLTAPTSTQFTVGASTDTNNNGSTYVAYLFAHNAGGFGLTGTDNVISCGSFTTDATTGNATVNLGFEPQWILTKMADGLSDWTVYDNMRGMSLTNSYELFPNNSSSEVNYGSPDIFPSSTGFSISYVSGSGQYGKNKNIIYIAIRRGPMKVPTDATKVFNTVTATGGPPVFTPGFVTDMAWTRIKNSTSTGFRWGSRLLSGTYADSSSTSAEAALAQYSFDYQNGWRNATVTDSTLLSWSFQRAPSFFDEVCYTGTGTAGNTFTHNLGVVPELIIIKSRNFANSWTVYTAPTGNTKDLFLNTTDAATVDDAWNNTTPTSSVVTLGAGSLVNGNAKTYVSYLFASCAGVSKVGSYTGNGSTQTINCGFTGGARFVLLKATSTTGNWMVYDTARGMTTLTDPFLSLNSTSAETATLGACTTVSTGFAVNESILAGVNTNGVSFVYLAIA